MNLLAGAGEFVLWCMAIVIGIAVVAIGALHAWDRWYARQIARHLTRGRK